jgi:hypothetical protein
MSGFNCSDDISDSRVCPAFEHLDSVIPLQAEMGQDVTVRHVKADVISRDVEDIADEHDATVEPD